MQSSLDFVNHPVGANDISKASKLLIVDGESNRGCRDHLKLQGLTVAEAIEFVIPIEREPAFDPVVEVMAKQRIELVWVLQHLFEITEAHAALVLSGLELPEAEESWSELLFFASLSCELEASSDSELVASALLFDALAELSELAPLEVVVDEPIELAGFFESSAQPAIRLITLSAAYQHTRRCLITIKMPKLILPD